MDRWTWIRLVIISLMTVGASAWAHPGTRKPSHQATHQLRPPKHLSLKAGTEITVSRYLKDADAFEVTINNEQGVGPNVATPEALKKALGMSGHVDEFRHKMIQDMGGIYVLKKPLVLLWDKEVNERAQKRR